MRRLARRTGRNRPDGEAGLREGRTGVAQAGLAHVVLPADVLPGEAAVLRAAERSLAGERRGLRRFLPFLGPAFIAAVAYVDPGNFATNMAGGARFGYLLLWVIVAANLMAMLVQSMSAKLGVATGRNLAEVCRDEFPRRTTILLWLQAEAVAMATDLAELVGAAIGLNLLFGTPLLVAGLIIAAAAFAVLALQARGFRGLETAIAVMVGVIVIAFGAQVFMAEPAGRDIAGGLVPGFSGGESLLLAVGIIGATVMPHVIYLHSALTQSRIVGVSPADSRRIFRFELVDVLIAMGLAGLINMAMLVTASAVFHARGLTSAGDDLSDVFDGLGTYLGGHANVLFGVALLASGLSSSSVGTLAGQVIMQGFLRRRIPIFLRRAITIAPALVVLAVGLDPSRALVISQVMLSFGIPFALVPLVIFCSRRRIMGVLVNRRLTTILAVTAAAVIVALNVVLLGLTFAG